MSPSLVLPPAGRRLLIASLTVVTTSILMLWLTILLAADGFSPIDGLMAILFTTTSSLVVLGFWNALIGAVLRLGGQDPVASVLPPGIVPARAIESRIAVLMPVCDEVPEAVFERLRSVQRALDLHPSADRFAYFVLSDSREAGLAARERALFRAWRAADPAPARLHYRRRRVNRGFKAGNIWEFCQRHGERFDLMVVLDADSVMTGAAIRRLIRIMEASPRLGILQPLIVGLAADSAFARLFQFGMRHGMRAFGTGSAWWQADEGAFWGHNAIVRVRPFLEHCALPQVPGHGPLAGDVLSHDQLEAVLMRRGGYEVRVLPVEDGSLEQTPPTLPDFVRRDLRWCQGNMQYLKLLRLPGIRPLGRLQLLLAIMLFMASPLWLGFLALGLGQAVAAGHDPLAAVDPVLGIGLFALMMTLAFGPKLIGVAEALLDGQRAASYGGRRRLLAGASLEAVFSLLLGPVMAVAHTIFIGGLLFGRRIRWQAQARAGRRVRVAEAAAELWPQTLIGLGAALLLALEAPLLLLWAAPVLLGLIIAVPFACLTSSPWLGGWLTRIGLCATPEELVGRSGQGGAAVPRPARVIRTLEGGATP